VSPRITSCLLIAIGFGAGAAVWTLAAGWGFLAALAVYSFVGSTALVAFAVMASLVPTRSRRASRDRPPPGAIPSRYSTYRLMSVERASSPRCASTKAASTRTASPPRSGAVKLSSSKTRSITV
jgi:hypothetical protein